MKNLLVLSIFVTTMIFGLVTSDRFDLSGEFESFLHRDCVRWTDDELNKPLFTLQEANNLLGKKVILANTALRKNKIGRIISFEMVAPDKFMIEIYWGNGADDENSTVTFHDKESFLKEFEVLD